MNYFWTISLANFTETKFPLYRASYTATKEGFMLFCRTAFIRKITTIRTRRSQKNILTSITSNVKLINIVLPVCLA